MKRHGAVDRLLFAVDEAVVVELILKLQHYLRKQAVSCLLLCFAVPLHHIGVVKPGLVRLLCPSSS